MTRDIIEKVQGFGFDVYMRKPEDTYMIFTDGQRLGYLEAGRFGFNLATVHKANRESGTGYQIERDVGDFDADALNRCFVTAPSWAQSSASSVKKYRDIAEYIAENSFNSEYALVAKA